MRTPKTNRFIKGVLLVLVLGVMTVGVSFYGDSLAALAQNVTTRTITRPPRAVDSISGRVRPIQAPEVPLDQGITVLPNEPSINPGTQTQPIPKFSAINAPVWFNEPSTDPVQILNDVVLHGFTDVRVGLISHAPAGGGGGGGGGSGGGTAPGAFNLIAPVNSMTEVALTPTFTWSDATGETSYTIEVLYPANRWALLPTIIYSNTALAANATTFTLPTGILLNNRNYMWRVHAVNSAGRTTAANALFSFQTIGDGARNAPRAFNLTSPADDATGVPLTPTFNWTDATGESSYSLEISTSNWPGAVIVYTHAHIAPNVTSFTLPSGVLRSDTTYYWRMLAGNGAAQTVAANAPFTFYTGIRNGGGGDGTAPGAFNLTAPANSMTEVALTPTFTWTDAAGETSYTLEMNTENDFSISARFVFVRPEIPANTTSFTLPTANSLLNNTTYFWRVRAINAAGQTVGENAPFSFQTLRSIRSVPSAFGLTAPENGVDHVSLTPTFTWTDATGETSYMLEVNTENDFSTNARFIFVRPRIPSNTTSFTFPPANSLLNSTIYFWRVRAVNAFGQTVAENASFSFKTKPPLPDLTIDVISRTPSAESVPSGTQMTFTARVRNKGTLDSGQTTTSVMMMHVLPDGRLGSLAGANEAPTRGLARGGGTVDVPIQLRPTQEGTFLVQMCANALLEIPELDVTDGATTDITKTNNCRSSNPFRVTPAPPPLPNPDLTVNNLRVTPRQTPTQPNNPIDFSATITNQMGSQNASDSTTRMQIKQGGNVLHTVTPARRTGTLNAGQSKTETFTWTPTAAGTYTFEVEADSAGTVTEIADDNNVNSSQFRVGAPSAFNLVVPADRATSQPLTPSFTWASSDGADSYTLEIDTTVNFSSPTLIYQQSIIASSSIWNVSGHTLPENIRLTYNTTYYWRVTAINANGQTVATGAPYSFTTIVAPPSAFNLTSPADEATSLPLTPLFQWTGSGGADSYTLEIDTTVDFSSSPRGTYLNRNIAARITSFTLPAYILSYNTTYYWRVTAVNRGGQTVATGSPYSFIVTLPGAFNLTSPVNGATGIGAGGISTTPMLQWNYSNNADSYFVEIDTADNFDAASNDYRIVQIRPGNITSYTSPALSYNTTYYWRVTAVNRGGRTTATNAPFSFRTYRSAQAPVGLNTDPSFTSSYAAVPKSSDRISLFGDFIPTAHALSYGGGDAGSLQGSRVTLSTPVAVYDDLYVVGNGSQEPGNLVVAGTTETQNLTVLGEVIGDLKVSGRILVGGTGRAAQFTGDVSVIAGTLTAGTSNFIGPVTVGTPMAPSQLTVNGTVRATQVGRFYTPAASPVSVASTSWTAASASCGAGDILISCSANFANSVPPDVQWTTNSSGVTCNAQARATVPQTPAFDVSAYAVCFSPDG